MDEGAGAAHHHSAGARHAPPNDIPVSMLAPTVLDQAHPARLWHGGQR
jgi:hypothetical protein